MEVHLHEWANLLVRWIHVTTGIAWIGASFYFNWLENNLERQAQAEGVAGKLWAIHGGGFYFVQKYEVAPPALPEHLHWFKWEAYFTWITGFTLLTIVYYMNARTMMIDPSVADITPWEAITISIAVLIGSWFVYDGLCRSPLAKRPTLLAVVGFALLVLLTWALTHVFSGRAAYIQVGAAIGTCMVANVFRVIIPSQQALVDAMSTGAARDPALGRNALLRSRHNNYLTLPVLFMMISNHFPSTYASRWNWEILAALIVISAGVRHYFNIRHLPDKKMWILPIATVAMLVLAVITSPSVSSRLSGASGPDAANAALPPVSFTRVQHIVEMRCAVCHSAKPTEPGFTAPPLGIRLDSAAAIKAHEADINRVAVQAHYMPLANLTHMTDAERQVLSRWIQASKN